MPVVFQIEKREKYDEKLTWKDCLISQVLVKLLLIKHDIMYQGDGKQERQGGSPHQHYHPKKKQTTTTDTASWGRVTAFQSHSLASFGKLFIC